jgi:hypothetical protein
VVWVCTVAGTPGTWVSSGGSPSPTDIETLTIMGALL